MMLNLVENVLLQDNFLIVQTCGNSCIRALHQIIQKSLVCLRHFLNVNTLWLSNIKALLSSSSSSFEGHPLQVRHKQDWDREFILLLPQAAALPGSDAGSDVIKPASSFVIQNHQTSCFMWCPMYRAHC